MKYYQIWLDVDVTGVKNGIHQIDINLTQLNRDERFKSLLTFFNTNNIDFWRNQSEIKNIKAPTIVGKLLKKANITDIMGYTQNIAFLYLVYSKRIIDIISSFNTNRFYTYEVDIENVKEKYYLLFFETIPTGQIIFEKSVIYTGHPVLNNVEYFKFSSYEEYWTFKQNNPLAKFEKIAISKKFSELDVICIQPTSLPFYSERLIDFLLDCGITGLEVNYKNSIQLEFL